MKRKRKQQTSQRQLTKQFLLILVVILLLINIAFAAVAFQTMYDYIEEQASTTMEAIQKNQATTKNWAETIDAYAKNEDDAIKITLDNGSVYYSNESEETFQEIENGKRGFLGHSFISTDDGFYFYEKEQMSTLTAELAIDTEAIFESVSNVFIIGIFLNIATLVIGVLLIYFVVRKWSFKLRQMTDEISEIRKNNQSLGRLTVPENPVEMYEVATAFNQLMEAQHKAMEREKQFITDASHELRTPLAAIRGHVQLIKRRGNDHPEIIQESIHFIDQESKRIEKMSNQLLTLEKYEQQSTEKLNLSDLVQDEIEKMSFLHDYLVEYEIEDAILFHAAKTDIQEILQNLLENAIKYTDAHKKIAVFLKENEKSIELLVEDNGIGIPDEAKEKIFERFYRVDSSHSSEIEGTGIGLSIVKKMVEKYHGTLIVRDNKPKGTVFQITFPK